MSKVVQLQPEVEEDFTAAIGMAIALCAFAMMFAGLFFVYAGLRARAPAWPPLGLPRPPIVLPTLNTIVIGLSSMQLHRALTMGRKGDAPAMSKGLLHTLLLGVVFVTLQGMLWYQMWSNGVRMALGVFSSVMYGLTVVHALHVAAGVVVLTVLYLKARSQLANRSTTGLRISGMFWHFVGAVWVVMYLSMFVV